MHKAAHDELKPQMGGEKKKIINYIKVNNDITTESREKRYLKFYNILRWYYRQLYSTCE